MAGKAVGCLGLVTKGEIMSTHLYLSLLPEALIFSQLDPDEFGTYYAVGSQKKSRGPAMFLEIDPSFRHPYFHMDAAMERCKPHEDGSPKVITLCLLSIVCWNTWLWRQCRSSSW